MTNHKELQRRAGMPTAATDRDDAIQGFSKSLKLPKAWAEQLVTIMERDTPKRRWTREERFIFNYLFSEPGVRRQLEAIADVVVPEHFGRQTC